MQNIAHQLAAPINAIKMNIDALKNPRVRTGRKLFSSTPFIAKGHFSLT